MIPLSNQDSQQLAAIRNGHFLYDGGFTKQPIKTLVGAHLLQNVRSLHSVINEQDSKGERDWSVLNALQKELYTVVLSGDN